MARYIIDTDELRESMANVAVEARGDFLRSAVTRLHEGTGNYPWATRIKGKKSDGGLYSEAFETFWEEYPKKVGKGGAFRAWLKVKLSQDELLRRCLKALKWQKQLEQWTKDKGQFIPNPQTYLNQARFEDDMPPEMNPERERQFITTLDGREIEV